MHVVHLVAQRAQLPVEAMSTVSIRMPGDLLSAVDAEAKRQDRARSRVIRDALEAYLRRCEQERLLETVVREARAVYDHPRARQDALGIGQDLDAADETDERWWR